MNFIHPLIHITLLATTLPFGCATRPTAQPPETSISKPQPPREHHTDPLEITENWLKTGLSTQNQPIHTELWTETQSWTAPRVTRITLIPNTDPIEYNATITDKNETPDHALTLTITQNQETWHITHAQQSPTRQLWPRF